MSQLARATRALKGIDQEMMAAAMPNGIYVPLVEQSTFTTVGPYGNDSALMIATFWDCVRVLAEGVASLPLILYRRLPGGGKERATDHELYGVLHDSPNPAMTSFVWRELLMSHLAVWGNAYNEISYDAFGKLQLWPIRPDRMEPHWGRGQDDGIKLFDYLSPSGQRTTLAPGSVLHIAGLSPTGLKGYSPVELHRKTLKVHNAARDFGEAFFRNGARPATVLSHPKTLSEGAITRLAGQMDDLRGSRNAGKTVILEEGLQITEVGIPPDDAQYIQTRVHEAREIQKMFRMQPHKVGDLERATFCLPADTDVLTTEGPRRIVEVTPGTAVWSFADGQWVESIVRRSELTGYDRVLTIRTTNRTLRANARHRVLARRRVKVATVGRGGWGSGAERHQVEWVTEYVEAGELAVGDTIVNLGRLPDVGSEWATTRRVSVGFAEFCGLLLGDGNVIFAGEKPVGVSIARGSGARYMDHYRAVMRDEFRARGDRQPYLQEQARFTRFASASAARELDILGLHGQSRTKRVPGWAFRLTADLRLALLRGYFDADGSVDKKGRISASSRSRSLLSDIRHLCMGLGIPVTNVRKFMPATGSIDGHAVIPSGHHYTFTCSDPGANLRIGSHDPQDQARLEAGRPFGHKGRAYPDFGGVGYTAGSTELARIASIEEGTILEPVYDLEVEGTHSFVADGVVVHNSNIEEQNLEHVTDTLRPWLVRFEQEINLCLLPNEPDIFPEFLVDGLLRGSALTRAQALAVRWQNGTLSPNEWRDIENQNPIEGGDAYYVPVNYAEVGVGHAPATVRETITEANPAAPPLSVVKSAAVRCANGHLLAELATAPYKFTCRLCHTVLESEAVAV